MENDGADVTQQPMTHMYAVEWSLSDIDVDYEKQLSHAHQYIPSSAPCNTFSKDLLMGSIRGSPAAPIGVLLCVQGPSQAQVTKLRTGNCPLPISAFPFIIRRGKCSQLRLTTVVHVSQLKGPFTITISVKSLSSALMDIQCIFCSSDRNESWLDGE